MNHSLLPPPTRIRRFGFQICENVCSIATVNEENPHINLTEGNVQILVMQFFFYNVVAFDGFILCRLGFCTNHAIKKDYLTQELPL